MGGGIFRCKKEGIEIFLSIYVCILSLDSLNIIFLLFSKFMKERFMVNVVI